ncbi:MAG: hypothetical protein ABIS67_07425 [Candidatus Eisenbacteria bacterium]
MTTHSVEAIVRALTAADVRYLIVGGLAVVAHGFVRFTADVDLVLDPSTEALRRAVTALGGLGYRPRAPVAFEEFPDPEQRARWMRDKGLTVFSLFSSEHGATEVDLFVEPPFDFEKAYSDAVRLEVAPGVPATFVALEELISMKRAAARPQDLQDVAGLEARREEGGTS